MRFVRQEPRVRASAQDSPGRRLPAFFLLVVALSVPFWIAGALVPVELLPGLPPSALQAAVPAIAALILVYRESGSDGVRALLGRGFDIGRTRTRAWYVPALLLMPAISLASGLMLGVAGVPLPAFSIPLTAVPLMLAAFFILGLGEELGWTGYATDPLQARWNALTAGLVLGVVTAAWHIGPLLQAHRSAVWIAWWYLGSVAGRVLMIWLYNNAGKSVFAATLFHMSSNLAWQLFPNQGSHWDPRTTGLLALGAAVVVTIVWGPRTLSRAPRPAA